jgi:hypothetical protein
MSSMTEVKPDAQSVVRADSPRQTSLRPNFNGEMWGRALPPSEAWRCTGGS